MSACLADIKSKMSVFSSDARTPLSRSFPRVSLRQSVSRNGRQRWDHAEIVQSEQIYLWKDNGHQQVHQEWGATGVQAANQTDSQDGELHLRWHIVIYSHVSAFCPAWPAGCLGDLLWEGWGLLSLFQKLSYFFHTGPIPPLYRSSVMFIISFFLAARQLYPPAHEIVWHELEWVCCFISFTIGMEACAYVSRERD